MLSKLKMSRYSLLNGPQSPTKDESNVVFLDGNDEDEVYTLEERDIKNPFYQRHLTAILVHASIVLCYIVLGAGILLRYKDNYVPDFVPSESHVTIDDRES